MFWSVQPQSLGLCAWAVCLCIGNLWQRMDGSPLPDQPGRERKSESLREGAGERGKGRGEEGEIEDLDLV